MFSATITVFESSAASGLVDASPPQPQSGSQLAATGSLLGQRDGVRRRLSLVQTFKNVL